MFVVRIPCTYSGATAEIFKLHTHIAPPVKTRPPDDVNQVSDAC